MAWSNLYRRHFRMPFHTISKSSPLTTKKSAEANRLEQLWHKFFADPSQWWDDRFDKKNPTYPDFVHKITKETLRVDDLSCPPWVQPKLAAMTLVKTEQLWHEFFSDPSRWWDNRLRKKNLKYPDFKHKYTNDVLWVESCWNPPWVKANIATMRQGQVANDGRFRLYDACVDCGAVGRQYNRDACKLCQQGQLKDAVQILELMFKNNIPISIKTCAFLLQGCIQMNILEEGKILHALIVKSGFEHNTFLGNTLVKMYAKCGNVIDAQRVFDVMPEHNVFSWTAIISAYVDQGQGEKAFSLYQQMQQENVTPNKFLFVIVLKICTSLAALEWGRQVHAHIIRMGYEADAYVGSSLVDMYAKCGSIENAIIVFSNIQEQDVVSCTAMIAGYAQQGLGEEAFTLFKQMLLAGLKPNKMTFVSILKACATIGALKWGKKVHTMILEHDFELDGFVGSALVDMYAKCGNIDAAHDVFNRMPQRDVVTWTAMISGYAQHGHGEEALKLFKEMQQVGVKPNNVTLVSLLKACADLAAIEQGKQIHGLIVESGFESDVVIGNALVDMYAKCGSIKNARDVFNAMQRDVISWNTLITGYVGQGQAEEALSLFDSMQVKGLKTDNATFVSILKACASLVALEKGKQIHANVMESGFESDVLVGSALIDMYVKCGSMEAACNVFSKISEHNAVPWNALIAGYAYQGQCKEALSLFEQMLEKRVKPDHVTFIHILSSCSHAGMVVEGLNYFYSLSQDLCIKPTMEHHACIVGLLGRAGFLDEAVNFIEAMPFQPNAVVWVPLLGASRKHCNADLGKYAFECVHDFEPSHGVAFVLLSNLYSVAANR